MSQFANVQYFRRNRLVKAKRIDPIWPEHGKVAHVHSGPWPSQGKIVKADTWDPLVCGHCGAPMTEPAQVGNHWMNTCTRCHHTREVPGDYPLLEQQQNNWPSYPQALQAVGPERAWVTAGVRAPVTFKQAVMTLPQQQRQWQRLQEQYPNSAEPVHRFPNGWSIQRPTSMEDAQRVGLQMRNCWQDAGQDEWTHRWNPHILHDEHDLPRAAFMMPSFPLGPDQPSGGQVFQLTGPRNHPPTEDAASMVRDWAGQQGYDFPDWLQTKP